MLPRPPSSPLFPYTTLFRSQCGVHQAARRGAAPRLSGQDRPRRDGRGPHAPRRSRWRGGRGVETAVERRSEEHTSELQSRGHLVCRLLLEKKKKKISNTRSA